MIPGHIKLIARQKVMRFILSEEGRVGSRTALSTATLVATSALAAMLIMPKVAYAGGYCPKPDDWLFCPVYCCFDGAHWNCSDVWDPGKCIVP